MPKSPYWTKEEDEILISLTKNGSSSKQCSVILNRGSYGCNERLRLLDLGITDRKLSITRKYELNEEFFDNIDTEEKAYILGFLITDGYNNEKDYVISIKLQERDKEILEKIRKIIGSNRPLVYFKEKTNIKKDGGIIKGGPSWSLVISSKNISQKLALIGCYQCKSLTARLPTIRSDLYNHLLRGIFDGDGSINITHSSQYRFQIYGNKEFLEDIQKLLINSVGVNKIKIYKHPTNNEYMLEYGGNNSSYKILSWIYNNSTIYLQRKYERFQNLRKKIEMKNEKC